MIQWFKWFRYRVKRFQLKGLNEKVAMVKWLKYRVKRFKWKGTKSE